MTKLTFSLISVSGRAPGQLLEQNASDSGTRQRSQTKLQSAQSSTTPS